VELTEEERKQNELENLIGEEELISDEKARETAFARMPNQLGFVSKNVKTVSNKVNNVTEKVGLLEGIVKGIADQLKDVIEKTSEKIGNVTKGIIPATTQGPSSPVSVFYPTPGHGPAQPTILMPSGQIQPPVQQPMVQQVQPVPVQSAGRMDSSPELLQVGGGGKSSQKRSSQLIKNLNKSLTKLNRNMERNRSHRKRKYIRSKLKRKYAL